MSSSNNKKTSAKKVMSVVAFVAESEKNSCTMAAKKFKMSPSTVRQIVDGKSHTVTTGLDHKTEKHGTVYLRKNKEMFMTVPKGSKNIMAKKPQGDKKSTKVLSDKPSVTTTTRPAKRAPVTETSKISLAGTIDISESVDLIRAEAANVVSKLDLRKIELENELKSISEQRTHWESLTK